MEGRKFVSGSGFTAADIMLGYTLAVIDSQIPGLGSLQPFPNVKKYFDQLKGRNSCQLAFPEE